MGPLQFLTNAFVFLLCTSQGSQGSSGPAGQPGLPGPPVSVCNVCLNILPERSEESYKGTRSGLECHVS